MIAKLLRLLIDFRDVPALVARFSLDGVIGFITGRFVELWLDWQIGRRPGAVTAEQRRGVGDSQFFQQQRRTGASLFSRSRTVRDDLLVLWQHPCAQGDFAFGHQDGSLDASRVVGRRLPDVEKNRFASLHRHVRFRDADARDRTFSRMVVVSRGCAWRLRGCLCL